MAIKAKFYVSEITKRAAMQYVSVTLLPVVRSSDTDNTDWSKYTPSGKMELSVSTDTGAAVEFERLLGKDVSITIEEFTPAE